MPRHQRPAASSLAALLALAAAGSAAAQTPLTWTTSRAGQPLLGPGGLVITDNSSRDGGESIVQVHHVVLDRFDAAAGVLVGVRGQVVVDSDTLLTVQRPANGGDYTGVGWVRAEWALQPGVTAFSGGGGLARIEVDRDVLAGVAGTWNPLTYSAAAAAIGGFVAQGDAGSLATSITTHLVAGKAKAGGGESRVVASTSSALTGVFSLDYSFLRHARAGFDALGATSLALQVGAGGADLSLRALGDAAHTTRLDLLAVHCITGACDADILDWQLQDLAAGEAVALHVGAGARSATYGLLLGDDRSVGAAASQSQQLLTLRISAVPEPGTWALWLAGVAWLGRQATRRPRRRPRSGSRQPRRRSRCRWLIGR